MSFGAWTKGGGAASVNVNEVIANLQDLTATRGNIFQIPPYFAYIAKSFSVLEGKDIYKNCFWFLVLFDYILFSFFGFNWLHEIIINPLFCIDDSSKNAYIFFFLLRYSGCHVNVIGKEA